jgi:hypothetical protein
MNRIDLAGRVAIVTGAARGIGCAIAKRCAGKGRQSERVGLFRGKACPRPGLAGGGGQGDRTDEIARQGACRDRDPRQLHDPGRCSERHLCPNDRGPDRPHAVEDPDGPLPARRRDRSAGRLAVFRGVLVLDRRRIRHFRRQGDLSGSERPLDRRGALGEPAHSHPITRRDGLLRRHP